MSYKKLQTPSLNENKRKKKDAILSSENSYSSAFPEIDKYVRSLLVNNQNCQQNNGNGYVRKISTSPCGWYLTYETANYRYCYNVRRPHKSNNVKFVVDLKTNKVCQTCHDPNCKDFR